MSLTTFQSPETPLYFHIKPTPYIPIFDIISPTISYQPILEVIQNKKEELEEEEKRDISNSHLLQQAHIIKLLFSAYLLPKPYKDF